MSFNSLQTGKHMERLELPAYRVGEGGFQFPSNGKAHGKSRFHLKFWAPGEWFQFPSNGKAHGKFNSISLATREGKPKKVSIPFKRESTWKVRPPRAAMRKHRSFNSLQTGKHMESRHAMVTYIPNSGNVFQFPSNGKAHGKSADINVYTVGREDRFNSLQTGKHMEREQLHGAGSNNHRFNSLQTGKHMERYSFGREIFPEKGFNSLQPGTGKHMESNTLVARAQLFYMCFNSLQTGKHMESLSSNDRWHSPLRFNSLQTGKHMESVEKEVIDVWYFSFNSLQTGKHMESSFCFCDTFLARSVSIPFKRESTWKECGNNYPRVVSSKVSIPFKRESTWKANTPEPSTVWMFVSIPFKRESTWKVKRILQKTAVVNSFNSLQTGKHMESLWEGHSQGND